MLPPQTPSPTPRSRNPSPPLTPVKTQLNRTVSPERMERLKQSFLFCHEKIEEISSNSQKEKN